MGTASKAVMRALAVALAMAMAMLGAVALGSPASASETVKVYRTCSTPGGCGLWLRTSASSSGKHVTLLRDGDKFLATCWVHGSSIYGNDVWLHGNARGKWGWSGDYYLTTHWRTTGDLAKQGIPHCGSAPAPKPSGTNAHQRAAISWAKSKVGQNYDKLACLKFVFDAYGHAGVNLRSQVNRSINGNTYPVDIWGHFSHGKVGHGTPPAGSLVFYSSKRGIRTDSHVAISVGGGKTVSTYDGVSHVVHYETVAQHNYANYLGWWLPNS